MISDELLRTALIASFEERMALCEREIEENPHRFSLAYKIRKRSIIKLAKRYEETKEPPAERHFMPLRRLALIMAIIAAAVILSVGAYAAYLIINGFVFDSHETYSDFTLDLSEYELKDSITEIYGFARESGVEYIDETIATGIVIKEYYIDGKYLLLTQYSKYYIEDGLVSNTEDSNIYGLIIDKNKGFTVTKQRDYGDDCVTIAWLNNGYVFSITSNELTNNELIKLTDRLSIEDYVY